MCILCRSEIYEAKVFVSAYKKTEERDGDDRDAADVQHVEDANRLSRQTVGGGEVGLEKNAEAEEREVRRQPEQRRPRLGQEKGKDGSEQ